MTKSLTIICPVYNEEEVLRQFYIELVRVLKQLGGRYDWQILFVLDRCLDRSLEIVKQIAEEDEKVRAIALSSRFGHQMSLVAGIDHSHTDILIMMDSDLQHPPEVIPSLLVAYEQGYDVVCTVRRISKDRNFAKRFASRFFYRVMDILSEVPLSAGEADFRLISNRVADVFRSSIRERNQFIRGLVSWIGFSRFEVVYEPNERLAGSSKYSWTQMLKLAAHGIVSFSKKPLQYATALGLIISILGFSFGLFILARYFLNDEMPSGWATIGVLSSVFGGFQLFFLGVLGEYIGAIFDEVKARPLYVIDERVNN